MILKRELKYTLLGIFLGGVVSVAAAYFITPKWESVSSISAAEIFGDRIETTTELVERLRAPLTIINVLKNSGLDATDSEVRKLKGDTKLSINGQTVSLKILANSRDLAINLAENYLKEVADQEYTIIRNRLERTKEYKIMKNYSIMNKSGEYTLEFKNGTDSKEFYFSVASFSIQPSAFYSPVYPKTNLFLILGALMGGIAGFAISKLNLRNLLSDNSFGND